MRGEFRQGFLDAVPVGVGYLAVSFTLGLAARKAGLTPLAAAFTSLITNTSAGQFAGFLAMAAATPLLETAFAQVVVNLRYVLMSSGLTQKVDREAGLLSRLLIAFDVTDELFALGIRRRGVLRPPYYYGMMLASIPCWALGTFLGALLGDLLPPPLLKAAGVALYAMFIAVVMPPARKSRAVLLVCLAAMAASWLLAVLPLTRDISSGLRVTLVALLLSALAASLFPTEKEDSHA